MDTQTFSSLECMLSDHAISFLFLLMISGIPIISSHPTSYQMVDIRKLYSWKQSFRISRRNRYCNYSLPTLNVSTI